MLKADDLEDLKEQRRYLTRSVYSVEDLILGRIPGLKIR